jgi:hypothetical protein
MIRQATVTTYLRGLSMLCMECAAQPRLLPVFLRILAMVPSTVAELQRRRHSWRYKECFRVRLRSGNPSPVQISKFRCLSSSHAPSSPGNRAPAVIPI